MSHEYCQPGGVEAHPQLSLISYYIAVMGEDEAYNRYNSISDVSLKFEINVHRLSFFSRSFIFVFFLCNCCRLLLFERLLYYPA